MIRNEMIPPMKPGEAENPFLTTIDTPSVHRDTKAVVIDLTNQGDPGSRYQPGLALNDKAPLSVVLADRARKDLIAEYRFRLGPEGRLSPPRDFSTFLGGADRLSAKDTQSDDVRTMLVSYFKTGQFGELTSDVAREDGGSIKIRYAAFLPPPDAKIKGVLTLVNGHSECMLKYAETLHAFRALRAAGYAVITYDHRGQGFSDRMLADSEKSYVEHFDDYVKDLVKVTDSMREALKDRLMPEAKWFIAGHSMGGGILTRYLEEHPDNSYAADRTLSPMNGIELGIPHWLGRSISDLGGVIVSDALDFIDKDSYAPGQGPSKEPPKFEGNVLTGCRERFELTQWLATQYRPLQIRGTSDHWAKEAENACMLMRKDADKIRTPTVMLRSAQDRLVDTLDQDAVAERGKITVKSFSRPEGQLPVGHELLNEEDAIRNAVLDELVAMLVS
jgi:lysophospholipase